MEFTRIPTPEEAASEEGFDPAVRWFAKRLGMTRAQVDQMTLDARRKVFFVTGLADLEAISVVQKSLEKALSEGLTFEEWKEEVKREKFFESPQFTTRRLETIFRTNMQNAFATGRYMEMTSPAMLKRRPYWKFSAVRDGRTTSSCAAAHGVILRHDHPWWKTHIPPLHFNCRSTIVPLSERRAKELGITQNPPPAVGALGFGNPPDGVPASAKDMPTEAERKKREAQSEKVQQAVEERNNAKHAETQAKRTKTATSKALEKAQKEFNKAPPAKQAEKLAALEKARRADVAADQRVNQTHWDSMKAEKKARAATERGFFQKWKLIPERLKRLARGIVKSAVELECRLLERFKEVKNGVLNGLPVLVLESADGAPVYFGRGATYRDKLMMFEGNGNGAGKPRGIQPPPKAPASPAPSTKPPAEKPISSFREVKRDDLFEIDPTNPKVAKIKQKATGIAEKTAQILTKEEIPAGKLPRVGPDIPERERERPQEPLGSRHQLPLTSSSRGKLENTMYSMKKFSTIQKDMDAIRNGEGIPVKIKTTRQHGEEPKEDFGFILKRDGRVRIYGMEHGGRKWRSFPVSGDGFLCLNYSEYKALFDIMFHNKPIDSILSDPTISPERLRKALEITYQILENS